MTVILRESAKSDIDGLVDYYSHAGGESLGIRFVQELQNAFETIAKFPSAYAIHPLSDTVGVELRRKSIRRFPDVGIFFTQEAESVVVIRVLHGKRDLAETRF